MFCVSSWLRELSKVHSMASILYITPENGAPIRLVKSTYSKLATDLYKKRPTQIGFDYDGERVSSTPSNSCFPTLNVSYFSFRYGPLGENELLLPKM